MSHHTKDKGDLAVALVIADLTKKGYAIFTPLSEHLPFDLIAVKDNDCYRIQVKYSSNGNVKNATSWADKTGNHRKIYKEFDFDYYAIYLAEKEVIVYPSISFSGINIRSKLPNSATLFYWWEDFKDFTTIANKRSYKDFNYSLVNTVSNKSRLSSRKVSRPTKEELEKLVWEIPTIQLAKQYQVSDVAISKWCKYYNITKPPRGYWTKQQNNKS